jgi:hypothetical protein
MARGREGVIEVRRAVRRDRAQSRDEDAMKKLLQRIEDAFAAAAFAEEGDAETARRMVARPRNGRNRA